MYLLLSDRIRSVFSCSLVLSEILTFSFAVAKILFKGSVSPQIHRPREQKFSAISLFGNENTYAINEISGYVWQDMHLPCR
ncbi:hypothetical protein Y032_0017g3186 [Ancylostoma ceylanicum]|uniref:Uncharacterized protein n=1 Tax=Ancylostoma ceylanicum TaxID=53326 RepID=A0A016V611_9BILA|nr:hypothetical protein Y032_0017g3186 [Ancylostoma ceylanicum]